MPIFRVDKVRKLKDILHFLSLRSFRFTYITRDLPTLSSSSPPPSPLLKSTSSLTHLLLQWFRKWSPCFCFRLFVANFLDSTKNIFYTLKWNHITPMHKNFPGFLLLLGKKNLISLPWTAILSWSDHLQLISYFILSHCLPLLSAYSRLSNFRFRAWQLLCCLQALTNAVLST